MLPVNLIEKVVTTWELNQGLNKRADSNKGHLGIVINNWTQRKVLGTKTVQIYYIW